MEWHEGDLIRKLREQMKWTLAEYAERTGVNISVIHRLERGHTRECKRSTLAKLAEPFGLTVTELLAAVPPSSPLVIHPTATKAPMARPMQPGASTRQQKRKGA